MERLSCGREGRERVIIVDNRLVYGDFDAIMKIEWFCGQLQGLKRRLLRRFRRRWGRNRDSRFGLQLTRLSRASRTSR